jgi:hypothetical protein
VLDARGASFVSITQSFNTTTSVGRLTLNVLLSFAQFEREVTGERIRDKVAASKKKGMWMDGAVPLGYDVRQRKLVVNEAEAAKVRLIFERYLQLGSLGELAAELDGQGVRSKSRILADGTAYGDRPFSKGALAHLLKNRVYIGEVTHKGAQLPRRAGAAHPSSVGRGRSEARWQAPRGSSRHPPRSSQPACWQDCRWGRSADDAAAHHQGDTALPLLRHRAGHAGWSNPDIGVAPARW